MKVYLKIPARIQSVEYAPGSHEMPDANAEDWFLIALVKDGSAIIEDQPKAKRGPKPKDDNDKDGE